MTAVHMAEDFDDIDQVLESCFSSKPNITAPVVDIANQFQEEFQNLETHNGFYEISKELEKIVDAEVSETTNDLFSDSTISAVVFNEQSLVASDQLILETVSTVVEVNETSATDTSVPEVVECSIIEACTTEGRSYEDQQGEPRVEDLHSSLTELRTKLDEERNKISVLESLIQERRRKRDELLTLYKDLETRVVPVVADPTFTVVLSRKQAAESIGLTVAFEASKGGFVVNDVKAEGLVPDYNKTAKRPIVKGNVIIEANGKSNDKDSMIKEFRAMNVLLKIVEGV